MAKPMKAQAIKRLRKALDAIPALEGLDIYSSEFKRWRRSTGIAITNTFGDESRHIREFDDIDYFSRFASLPPREKEKTLKSAAALLQSMIEEVEEDWEEDTEAAKVLKKLKLQQPGEDRKKEHQPPPNTREVFVIHGRDEAAKQKVARFLEKLDLTPVILHEQPNQGQTIIEKFEQHAQVGFAVALLTPDDAGALQGEAEHGKPRARQNVVFELGYFLGCLGRKRVCALVKGEDLERPSDYAGVAYIPLDDYGGWEKKLVKELKEAGFEIDANRMVE